MQVTKPSSNTIKTLLQAIIQRYSCVQILKMERRLRAHRHRPDSSYRPVHDQPPSRLAAWSMGELQYPGAPSVADDERQYRAPFRRAPQYRWPAPQPPQPSAFAPWRRAPAPPRPPDYRRSASYPGKPDEPYQVSCLWPFQKLKRKTSALNLYAVKATSCF